MTGTTAVSAPELTDEYIAGSMNIGLSKAVKAAVDYLNSSGEYVGKVDDPTDVCLDGWFDIDQLVTKAIEAFVGEIK